MRSACYQGVPLVGPFLVPVSLPCLTLDPAELDWFEGLSRLPGLRERGQSSSRGISELHEGPPALPVNRMW